MACADPFGQSSLELVDYRTLRKQIRAQNASDGLDVVPVDALPAVSEKPGVCVFQAITALS